MRVSIDQVTPRVALSLVATGIIALSAASMQPQSLGGDFSNTTIKIAEGTDGDMAFEVQRGDDGNPGATGGVTVKAGDTVAFDNWGHLSTNTAGWWKASGDNKYIVGIRDTNGRLFLLLEVHGEVRWNSNRNVVEGAQNFLRLSTKSKDALVEITKREKRNGRLVVTAKDGSVYTIYKLSCDFSGTGLRIQTVH
jgi:hypothetical protein